jgi:hypothetical protein
MQARRFRIPFLMSVTVFFLLFSLSSSPSDPSIPDLHQLPPAPSDDEAAHKDLARWMVGRREGTGLQVMSRGDLAAATSSQPRHFDLFGSDLDAQSRGRFLAGLPYGSVLSLAAERHRVDGLLLAAIVEAESGFRPHRVSPRGAVGLMQILPATAKAYGAGDLLDPHFNVDVGSRYLAYLLESHEDLESALAAYNAGPAAVERYGGVPPFRETRAYVKKVKARYEEYQRQARQQPHGFELPVARRVAG